MTIHEKWERQDIGSADEFMTDEEWKKKMKRLKLQNRLG